MLVIIGSLIVTGCVIGGFMMVGGKPASLWHPNEIVVICGAALGSMIIMSPMPVLKGVFSGMLACLKPSPYNKQSYEDLFKALYELFMLGRRNGMIALEEHVMNPEGSSVFSKYPALLKNHHAIEFLCGGLRPIIDGKIKPDQLKMILEVELEAMENDHHAPTSVLQKVGDSFPGFGIVAAVLGIILTMGAITGPIEAIGYKVGSALVGTFLGILVAYGYVNPLVTSMEFLGESEAQFNKTIATSVVGFANGMAPIMAVEVARRGLSAHVKPDGEDFEKMLKEAAPANG